MISAVIITYNEEERIRACIASLKAVVDEVILVDANSTDNTVNIANSMGAKVFIKQWQGYGFARNYGASKAKNEWILSIDADECISPRLSESIQAMFLSGNEVLEKSRIYRFHRQNIYKGREIRFGFLKSEKKPKLYNRVATEWESQKVHEQLKKDIDQTYHDIEGILFHWTYDDQQVHRKKLSYYADLVSQEWIKNEYTPNLLIRLLGPSFHFIKTYLLQLGFVEGSIGFETSFTAYHYSAEKYRFYKRNKKF